MAGLLQSIRLRNILSFKDARLSLDSLNVFIGPNASGKSNLIDAIGLLQAAPGDLNGAILRGGGAPAWLWKGKGEGASTAGIDCEFTLGTNSLAYSLDFSAADRTFLIEHESLRPSSKRGAGAYFERSGATVKLRKPSAGNGPAVQTATIGSTKSVFSAIRDPLDPTPVTRLATELERIRIYRSFDTSPLAPTRTGASAAGVPKEFLEDKGSNLAVVVQEMLYNDTIKDVNGYLRRLADYFEEVKVRLDSGVAQLAIKEKDIADPVAATRLSDGTLKFLCLMVVLLHASPPPLICIEEPELGLHPDALQLVAEVLERAAARTQLIVTTHSEALIDTLSGKPEAVVVCERDFDNATSFRRLSSKDLRLWLERYRLGELWRKGEIGGNRW
ncbi:MAG TPA: AAA family ATPase [Candidatus Margulisiibacteriota bacterium]|nr:AAA family ATPase [Verrucomicrobiae bacterium]HVO25964.1 AAA family ATPase [Candidatus Margulisiibacteriota bacterium]